MALRVRVWGNHYINGWQIVFNEYDYGAAVPTGFSRVDLGGNSTTWYWAYKAQALDAPVQCEFSDASWSSYSTSMPAGQFPIIPLDEPLLYLSRAGGPGAGYISLYMRIVGATQVPSNKVVISGDKLISDNNGKIVGIKPLLP